MTSPIAKALGGPRDPITCKVVVPGEVEIHWYPQTAHPGDHCMCGKRVMKEEQEL